MHRGWDRPLVVYLQVTVGDEGNKHPVIGDKPDTGLFEISVAENTGGILRTFAATDGNGDDIIWSLEGTDAASLTIYSSGQLTLASGTLLDYETKPSYTFRVKASDARRGAEIVDVNLAVTDVATETNQAPSFARTSVTRKVFDNATGGTPIGARLVATDPEGQALRYSLDAAGDAVFDIGIQTGQLSLGEGVTLDATLTPSYTFTVTATDPHGATGTLSVTVNVDENVGDYNSDDDGLIEIGRLAQLDAVRWDLDGDCATSSGNESTYAAAFPGAVAKMGCPSNGCIGYELTADLNFDTNGNGSVDSSDGYWDEGKGWEPFGDLESIFDGNDHTISNMFINRDTSMGLFSVMSGTVRNLGACPTIRGNPGKGWAVE